MTDIMESWPVNCPLKSHQRQSLTVSFNLKHVSFVCRLKELIPFSFSLLFDWNKFSSSLSTHPINAVTSEKIWWRIRRHKINLFFPWDAFHLGGLQSHKRLRCGIDHQSNQPHAGAVLIISQLEQIQLNQRPLPDVNILTEVPGCPAADISLTSPVDILCTYLSRHWSVWKAANKPTGLGWWEVVFACVFDPLPL